MAYNQKRAAKMKTLGPKALETIAKSGSLASAAAEYEIARRKSA